MVSNVGQQSGTPLRVLLVDPALFTAPYDAALSRGLEASGVDPRWATRRSRSGEAQEIPEDRVEPIYYPGHEDSAKKAGLGPKIAKGVSHLGSVRRLVRLADRLDVDIVHFQWILLPAIDLLTIRQLQRRMPVVLTVHDTSPFNGNPTSQLQIMGFDRVLKAVDHVIVHTATGREVLSAAGVAPEKISIISHGPLRLSVPIPDKVENRDPRWTFTLFGRLQDYKGIDVLIDALALIPEADRARMRVAIAGRAFVDMAPLLARAKEAGVGDTIDWRVGWLSEAAMATLFAETDSFIFPYRRIEASGVYYLVKGLGKWIVASSLGAFREEIKEEIGELVPPADPSALALALIRAVGRRPAAGEAEHGWDGIGASTAELYHRFRRLRNSA